MPNLDDYIITENLLFEQLDKTIYGQITESQNQKLNRYFRGSWSDPNRFKLNWNRTVELPVTEPKARVLMLHGLSDSPYSMRSLALGLQKHNAWVVALRLPGHGTIPASLDHVKWQDFAAAVRLAARHLEQKVGTDVPFYIVGYSDGAALALEYSLSEILGEQLQKPDGLILISPAVAVSPMAVFAGWNQYLAKLPGLEKLAWLSIEPEYDPYKYNSFAINAGEQIYKLTKRIDSQFKKLEKQGALEQLPKVLAMQSVVDATLEPQALLDNLMNRLSPNGHELVLFDVNRVAADMILMKNNMQQILEKMMDHMLPFTLSLVTNRSKKDRHMKVQRKVEKTVAVLERELDLSWPAGVYSLSHIALPFSETDPLYGVQKKGDNFSLGQLEVRGERGVLSIPDSNLIRMRYNPFYRYLENRVEEMVFVNNR